MSSIAINPGMSGSLSGRRPAARPVARTAARTTAAPVRLTRRGRLVVTVVFLALVLAALTVFGARSAATGETGAPMQTRVVEVAEGDTLWGIASSVAEPGETQEMVLRIQELNALTSVAITEGQEIAVPVG